MSLQNTLDPLRLYLERKALRVYMGKYQVANGIYICIDRSDLQHYFLSKLKFLHNPTLLPVTTSTYGGKKVRILSQLRELGLPVGDANRTLFLKQWPT
jgi:hypothetical protein